MKPSEEAATPENVGFIAAIAQPGDTVLIGFADPLDQEEIESLDEAFEPLRRTGVEIGFTDGVSSMVVIRPGDGVARGFLASASDADLEKEFPNG